MYMAYAGFWKRFAALLIDMLVLVPLTAIFGGILGFLYGLSMAGTVEGAQFIGQITGVLVPWIYHAAFESSDKQATPGKMVLGIKVVDMEGSRISFGRATGRHFAKIISSIILMIGYLMAAFTQKKQALHDIMAGCLVVNKA
jgi:uncharacterized RDD family membrane protein YckC